MTGGTTGATYCYRVRIFELQHNTIYGVLVKRCFVKGQQMTKTVEINTFSWNVSVINAVTMDDFPTFSVPI